MDPTMVVKPAVYDECPCQENGQVLPAQTAFQHDQPDPARLDAGALQGVAMTGRACLILVACSLMDYKTVPSSHESWTKKGLMLKEQQD